MEDLIIKFLIALAIGALIGIERERKGKTEFAGIRTLMLISLMGAVSAYLSMFFPLMVVLAFAGVFVLVVASYVVSTRDNGDIGITGEVAALLTFLLGVLCYASDYRIATILAIITTAILALKKYIHVFVRKISEREMIDTIKFLMVAFVILPLLPNTRLGPWGVFNPYQIWLMVVFISGISYAGYIAMKITGPESGLSFTGVIGGLVSSTAVVTAMSGRVRDSSSLMRPALFAAVIASSMMFLRILFEVAVINPSLLGILTPPMLVMGTLGIVIGVLLLKTPSEMPSQVELKNPFSLRPALIFGALFMGILFLSKAANIYLGRSGVFITSMISGVADVDAITVSMALLAGSGSVSASTATAAITIASISNTIVKAAIAFIVGTKKFGRSLSLVFLCIIISGLLAVLLVSL